MKIPAHPLPVHGLSVHMQKRCLGQGWKSLMQAVYDHVRSQHVSIFRKCRVESEMSSVGLIQNEYAPSSVDDISNASYVRNNTVICGGRNDNCFYIRVLIHQSFHLFRRYLPIQRCPRQDLGIEIDRFQLIEENRIIYGFVAVARHEDLPPSPGTAEHCAQYPHRTSIDKIMRLPCMINRRSPLLRLFQQPIRMVQIVKAFNLCDVDLIRKVRSGHTAVALVSRHVESIIAG